MALFSLFIKSVVVQFFLFSFVTLFQVATPTINVYNGPQLLKQRPISLLQESEKRVRSNNYTYKTLYYEQQVRRYIGHFFNVCFYVVFYYQLQSHRHVLSR